MTQGRIAGARGDDFRREIMNYIGTTAGKDSRKGAIMAMVKVSEIIIES
jgi:hypothetical protein